MTKPTRKNRTDIIRLKSFVYWIGKALAELQSMTPETRQMMDEAMREIGLPKITDLTSLEKVLSTLSITGHDNSHSGKEKQA